MYLRKKACSNDFGNEWKAKIVFTDLYAKVSRYCFYISAVFYILSFHDTCAAPGTGAFFYAIGNFLGISYSIKRTLCDDAQLAEMKL